MIVAVVGVRWSAGAVVGAASWRLDNVAVAAGLALVSRSRDQFGGAFVRWTRACRQDSVSTRAEVGVVRGSLVWCRRVLGAMLFCDARSGLALAKAQHVACRSVVDGQAGRLAPLVLGAMRYGGRYGIDYCGSWQ